MARKFTAKAVYTATALAILTLTAGFVMASVVTITTANQTASVAQANGAASQLITSGSGGAISIAPGTIPAAVSTCTSGVVAFSSGGSVVAYVSSSTGVTTCSTGDYAEVITINTGSTAPADTYKVTITTQFGSGPTTGVNSVSFANAAALSSSATITIYVDYGGPAVPAGGIALLQAVISP